MDLRQYKAIFLVVTGILALLVASPALQKLLVYPQTKFFTEFWILGPRHNAQNYPYNITNNGNYSVFLGVANHLGSCAYYAVEVKFRNRTQSAPDSLNHTHSSLGSLYRVNFFVPDKGTWELPLTFSFDYYFDEVIRTIYQNVTTNLDGNVTYRQAVNVTLPRANFGHLKLNGVTLSLQGLSSDIDLQTREFFGNLFFELWVYDVQTASFVYHECYVDLKLNMTRT